jgi:hypothetical protein
MPLIRCTGKLLTEMDARAQTSEEPTSVARLGDWYAHLLSIEHKKCVIFASERTLLTFLTAGLGRDAIRDYGTLLRDGLLRLLENEGFARDVVARALDEYQELTLATTNDRSVLGSLNDLARLAAGYIERDGGLRVSDLGAVNHRLNQTPMKRLGMESPINATRRVLGGGDPSRQADPPPSRLRKKRPGYMTPDEVEIERQGDAAVLTPRDSDIAVTNFQLGPQLTGMTDEHVLDLFNATIAAQKRLADKFRYVAVEVPPGRPQIRYFSDGDQWAPRGGVVRCVIEDDEDGQVVIYVDDRKLTLEEFGRMLVTYAGWGMRIEFTPDDETEHRPRLDVREPDEN